MFDFVNVHKTSVEKLEIYNTLVIGDYKKSVTKGAQKMMNIESGIGTSYNIIYC